VKKSSLEFYRLFYKDLKNGNVLTDVICAFYALGWHLLFYYIFLTARSPGYQEGDGVNPGISLISNYTVFSFNQF